MRGKWMTLLPLGKIWDVPLRAPRALRVDAKSLALGECRKPGIKRVARCSSTRAIDWNLSDRKQEVLYEPADGTLPLKVCSLGEIGQPAR